MTVIPVVIISTNALTRGGIQQIIAQSEVRIETAGIFASFTETSAFLKDHKARVVIIDDLLPRGINLAKELKNLTEVYPGLAVILIAQRPTLSLAQLMIRVGVRGILHKDDDLERTLNQAIQLALTGGMTISPRVSQLMEQQQTLPSAVEQRDMDVLQLLTEGFQPKEIAAHLGIDRRVVYRIIKKLCRAYDAQNVAQLVRIVEQQKLLSPKKE